MMALKPGQSNDIARDRKAASHGGRKILAIGASTGGVEALITILTALPVHCAPTVITLHMPAIFTRSFAQQLNRLCAPCISEARHGAVMREGQIYLAPGGSNHLEVRREGANLVCALVGEGPVNGHRPSVDVLFNSVEKAAGSKSVGVILTGMGCDGAAGLKRMRDSGAFTIGQDEESSVVYGMPRAAFEKGAVDIQLSPAKMIAIILAATCGSGIIERTARLLKG